MKVLDVYVSLLYTVSSRVHDTVFSTRHLWDHGLPPNTIVIAKWPCFRLEFKRMYVGILIYIRKKKIKGTQPFFYKQTREYLYKTNTEI